MKYNFSECNLYDCLIFDCETFKDLNNWSIRDLGCIEIIGKKL